MERIEYEDCAVARLAAMAVVLAASKGVSIDVAIEALSLATEILRDARNEAGCNSDRIDRGARPPGVIYQ